MSLIPKVTTEDVRLALNGVYSGSNYVFWGQSIPSGSILAQINMANIFLYGALGYEVMDSTDLIMSYQVNACELDYAIARVITLLSGDVIVDGFTWTAGITVQQPLLLATYRNLQSAFLSAAQMQFRTLQKIQVSAEGPGITYRTTAPSVF